MISLAVGGVIRLCHNEWVICVIIWNSPSKMQPAFAKRKFRSRILTSATLVKGPVDPANRRSRNAQLVAGDVAVFATRPTRTRVAAARQRGARVVQPKWQSAVAQLAESLIGLHRDLAAEEPGDGLVAGLQACGPGQAKWDPERAVLVDADDPVAAAQRAGTEYMLSIIRGSRRL